MLRIALGLMVAGIGGLPVVSSLAAQTVSTAESPLAGFPGLGRAYHHVSGRTVEQIRASLRRLELTDPASGQPIEAYTEWHLSWWIPEDGDGGCLLDRAEVLLDVTVGLPRLVDADAVPADVVQRWHAYVAALEAHEATHVRNAYRARSAMLRAIRRADCASAGQVAAEAMDALRRRDEEYDRRTRHGVTEGVRFP